MKISLYIIFQNIKKKKKNNFNLKKKKKKKNINKVTYFI